MRHLCSTAIVLAGLLSVAVPVGCGGATDSAPIACLNGPDPYIRALRAAPGEVRLGADVPISDCLAENQQGGDLATVGAAMVATTARLNAQARSEPRGPAALRLGYLVGAAQRGAAETGGIHAELIRRLNAAARYRPEGQRLPTALVRAYRTGLRAGRAQG